MRTVFILIAIRLLAFGGKMANYKPIAINSLVCKGIRYALRNYQLLVLQPLSSFPLLLFLPPQVSSSSSLLPQVSTLILLFPSLSSLSLSPFFSILSLSLDSSLSSFINPPIESGKYSQISLLSPHWVLGNTRTAPTISNQELRAALSRLGVSFADCTTYRAMRRADLNNNDYVDTHAEFKELENYAQRHLGHRIALAS